MLDIGEDGQPVGYDIQHASTKREFIARLILEQEQKVEVTGAFLLFAHLGEGVAVDGVLAAGDADDHRQADAGLGGGDGDGEQRRQLAPQRLVAGQRAAEADEAEVDGVEHDLDAHEHEEEVAARQHHDQAEREQRRGQQLLPLDFAYAAEGVSDEF